MAVMDGLEVSDDLAAAFERIEAVERRVSAAETGMDDLTSAVGAIVAFLGPQRLSAYPAAIRAFEQWRAIVDEQQRRRDLERARRTLEQVEARR